MSAQPHILILGAGPGVAQGMAQRFGREGFRVTLVARRLPSLQTLRDELAAQGTDVATYAADVADDATFRPALDRLLAERGPATVLLYNPSVYREADVLTLAPATFLADMAVSAAGLLSAIQAVVPAMQQAGGGAVLVTGGGSALRPYGPLASLSAGKAAVRVLAECARQTLAPLGIRVATLTINGMVGSNEHFAPDRIADRFWALYQQPPGAQVFEETYE